MRRLPLLLLLPALLVPAVAQARPLDALRKAQLKAVTATVSLTERRCPPGSANCGTTKLVETFLSGPKVKTRAAEGRPGFPAGVRIAGKGSGECDEESPSVTITGPDGSVQQFLDGAVRVTPGRFGATQIAVASSKRGVRVAWLEPLAPSVGCDFFSQPDTVLSLPSTTAVPDALVSPAIGSRVLRRARFSIRIAGSKEWNETAADGQLVTGHASWKLRLDYVTRRPRR
jgi:hypothetical protein